MAEMLYTIEEVSKIFKTNKAYVYNLIKAGHLKCLKLGSYKVRHSEIERFLAEFEGWDLTKPENITKMEV